MVPGVTYKAVDVLAKGDYKTSHDVAVFSLLKTAQSNNLKFNSNKIHLKMKECKFFGQLLTQEDMSINQKKVDVIRKMDLPHAKMELESFQGMVNSLK